MATNVATGIYTPDASKLIHVTSVDFNTRYINAPVHLVQYDNSTPIIEVNLYTNGTSYAIPTGSTASIRFKKIDDNMIYNPALGCNSARTKLYFEITTQMSALPGDLYPVIEIAKENSILGSAPIHMVIDENPLTNADIVSSSEGKTVQEYVKLSESWAIGGTGMRPNEDNNNAKAYSALAEIAKEGANESEGHAKLSERAAKTSENNANDSKLAAKLSEDKAKVSADNAKTSEDNAKASETNAATSETNSANSSILSESWAIGGTGTRTGEDTNNAKYYCDQAKSVAYTPDGVTIINNSGTISVPTATNSDKGIVKADNSSIKNTNGELSVPTATSSDKGIVKPDNSSIKVNSSGTISVPTATNSDKGIVKADNSSIKNTNGELSVPTATSSDKGIVKPDDDTIKIDNGTLSSPMVKGVKEIVGADYVNLIPDNVKTQYINGVMVTLNAGGRITLNGTATADTNLPFTNDLILSTGNYVLSGAGTGCNISINKYVNDLYKSTEVTITGTETKSFDNSSWTTPSSTTKYGLVLYFAKNAKFTNLVVSPMLNIGTVAQPYVAYISNPLMHLVTVQKNNKLNKGNITSLFNPSTAYVTGDSCYIENTIYESLKNQTGVTPIDNLTAWKPISIMGKIKELANSIATKKENFVKAGTVTGTYKASYCLIPSTAKEIVLISRNTDDSINGSPTTVSFTIPYYSSGTAMTILFSGGTALNRVVWGYIDSSGYYTNYGWTYNNTDITSKMSTDIYYR